MKKVDAEVTGRQANNNSNLAVTSRPTCHAQHLYFKQTCIVRKSSCCSSMTQKFVFAS